MAHTVINGKFYVDTAFLNSLYGIPGVSLEHMGFGEFYATTPHGTVDFDRMRGTDFPGQSGRSHQAYDREGYGTKATEWLIDQVESRGKSVRVASGDATLRSRIIRLAASRPDLRPHLLPLVASEDDIPFEVRGPGGLLFVNVRAPEIWVRTVPSDPPYNQEYYSLELDVFGPKRPAKAARKVYDDNKAEIMRLRTFREVREFIDERVLALVGRKPSWRERFSVFD